MLLLVFLYCYLLRKRRLIRPVLTRLLLKAPTSPAPLDILFFKSRDNNWLFLPSYLTHTAILLDGMVVDMDPCLTGVFRIPLGTYLEKYCGDVYHAPLLWSSPDERARAHARALAAAGGRKTCTGFVLSTLFEEKQGLLTTPDDLLLALLGQKRIKSLRILKRCGADDPCRRDLTIASRAWRAINPCAAPHVSQSPSPVRPS